jgi:hypothetical protein
MENIQKNHSVGKKGENETWPFLKKNGFIRPQKNNVRKSRNFTKRKEYK